MLFTKFATFISLSLLAVATPMPNGGSPTKIAPTTTVTVTATATTTEPASQCNTGPIQCCNTVTTAGDSAAAGILGLLGIVVQDLDILVGLTCTPITIIGTGGASCNAHPVCCEDNSHGDLISIGCVPVDISL
ncbi:fungal hydrophobin [Fomitiporia mediterranea MF3/22]|uniref:fungal hydrophobin n=1 Tax=Fomitiporia mediterranea (strain MF3/22) TaxID=694068 RepID=UPI000440878D|nr:fungal hydrophobin [Fomitiporia mediterranea MF3/22]EJD01687.1 fungal hydrophobin [Fomitiporia mediterranea MF3/22]